SAWLQPAGANAGVVQLRDNGVRKQLYQLLGFSSRILRRLQAPEQAADGSLSSAQEPFVRFQILRIKKKIAHIDWTLRRSRRRCLSENSTVREMNRLPRRPSQNDTKKEEISQFHVHIESFVAEDNRSSEYCVAGAGLRRQISPRRTGLRPAPTFSLFQIVSPLTFQYY